MLAGAGLVGLLVGGFGSLACTGLYAIQQARKAAAAALAAARAAKRAAARAARAVAKAAKVVARAAVKVGKVAYKVSGVQSVVSCATHPTLAGCVQAGIAIVGDASLVATGGADAGAVVAGEEFAASASEEVAEGVAGTSAEGAGGSAAEAGEEDGFDAKDFGVQMAIGAVSGAVGDTLGGYEDMNRAGEDGSSLRPVPWEP